MIKMSEEKMRYIELIQNIINRMSGNSFMLKGWAVSLLAGFFALAPKDTDKMFFVIAYVPIVVFCLLDSYYLQQERLYRALYEKARKQDPHKIDYSLNVSIKDFPGEETQYLFCLISKTELLFYFPLAMICTIVIHLI